MGMPLSWLGPVSSPVGVAHRTRYSTAPCTLREYLPRVGELPCASSAVPASAVMATGYACPPPVTHEPSSACWAAR